LRGDGRSQRFLRACRRRPVDRTPVWFMRQVGRYLPEYRRMRRRHGILEICKDPELSARATLLPVERLGVDAAILFADIMLPLEPAGVRFRLVEGLGPVVESPIRSLDDVEGLRPVKPERDLPYVLESIRRVKGRLAGMVPLIGFSAAPFTLAAYLVEGRPSRDFWAVKGLMYSQPGLWHALMKRLAGMVVEYMRAQVAAGVDALQLFDSWAGCLSPADYEEHVLPYTRDIFRSLRPLGVPMIYFSTGTAGHLDLIRTLGADVVGIDWRVRIDDAWDALGDGVAVQGNLDPAALLADFEVVRARAMDIIDRVGGRPGHIFNLGHGVLPHTPVENLRRLVDLVHDATG
jgi:uroporphyrinogen decarboxylase